MSPDHDDDDDDDDDDDETKELDAPWPFGPWAHKKSFKIIKNAKLFIF